MSNDNCSRILRVDLSTETIRTEEVKEQTLKKFIGGAGLAASILWSETNASTRPLSPETPLIFMTGPLTGTPAPSANIWIVAAISPLTGIYGEAHGAGTWAVALSRTGYMGIVIKGAANRPVYLDIDDDRARILDASHLWGKDTYETVAILQAETGRRTSVATIGVAGERLVSFASVMGDGPDARAAARTGMGAVMGYKKLKAIAVRGTRKPSVYDREGLKSSVRRHFPPTVDDSARTTQRIIDAYAHLTDSMAGLKNFTLGEYPGFGEKSSQAMIITESRPCAGCRTSCVVSGVHNKQRHMHAEHFCPGGANALIDDMEALHTSFEVCNRSGMDCISAGNAITFAIECYEKGLISKKDTDGLELKWGNAEAMVEMMKKVGRAEGFGRILAQGVRKAAEHIGQQAAEYAIHVKGLDLSFHDPRCHNAWALRDATASRGGDHLDGATLWSRGYQIPYLKSQEAKEAVMNPTAIAGIAELTAWSQNFDNLMDSMTACKFLYVPKIWLREYPESFTGIKPEQFVEWLNFVTGWGMGLDEFMRSGERIFNLKRMINVRRGISRKDDFLPPRLLTLPRGGKSEFPDHLIPMGTLLKSYYEHRGWSEEGIPTKQKLAELDLKDVTGRR
ncbi:MAG: aldehyde ferredoxin oxidoreductase family protein [Chloroflexi bacterium]|nr:aldehyde ferredoxin oxidoreductase family protein [Chloroflexota bacterium]